MTKPLSKDDQLSHRERRELEAAKKAGQKAARKAFGNFGKLLRKRK